MFNRVPESLVQPASRFDYWSAQKATGHDVNTNITIYKCCNRGVIEDDESSTQEMLNDVKCEEDGGI